MSRRAALLLVLALAGCDGVGRALVETGARGQIDDLACQPQQCKALPAPTIPPLPASETDPKLGSCTPLSVALCEPAVETAPGFSRPAAGVCQRSISLDDDVDLEALRHLACAKIRLARTHGGPAVLRVEDVHWSQLELEVESSDTLALELVRANLDQLQIRLHGPVTLRVIDSPEVTALSLATDSPSASVDLRASDAQALAVGTTETEFAGTLASTQSTLQRLHVFARDVQLEIVSLRDATIEAEQLQFVDVTSRRLSVSFELGLIASSRLTAFEVKRCGALSLYGTNLAGFRMPPCADAPTRIVASSFLRGSLDGDILADSASFERVAFGLREPTDLQLWDNNMTNVNFCANTDHVVLGGKNSAQCATCRELDGSMVPIDPCRDADSSPLLLKSCRAFEVLETCDPDPERMRPPFK